MRLLLSSLVMLAILTVTACGESDSSDSDLPVVVTTTSIWGDVVSEMAGEHIEVVTVIPPGADTHDFQPSPRQIADMESADLVIANGLGLEEGLADVLAGLEGDGVKVFEVAPHLDPIELGEGHDDEDESLDPHVWFDPDRVADGALLIADQLADVEGSIDWHAIARQYAADIREVSAEMENLFAGLGQRDLVTNHESLGYLAERFGFEVVGVVIPGGSTLGDPSSSELATLVATIEARGIQAIFAETSSSSDLAAAVAAEVGRPVEIVELYTETLGEPGSGADTYPGMLLTNARLIAEALG